MKSKRKGTKKKKTRKKRFLYNPNNPKKSFDVYIDKNPNDTIPIKYTTVKDVEKTIKKLERLYKTKKYPHKRIWQVGMIMKVRLEAMNKYKKTRYPNAKNVFKRYQLSKRYFKFLGNRSKKKTFEDRKKMTFNIKMKKKKTRRGGGGKKKKKNKTKKFKRDVEVRKLEPPSNNFDWKKYFRSRDHDIIMTTVEYDDEDEATTFTPTGISPLRYDYEDQMKIGKSPLDKGPIGKMHTQYDEDGNLIFPSMRTPLFDNYKGKPPEFNLGRVDQKKLKSQQKFKSGKEKAQRSVFFPTTIGGKNKRKNKTKKNKSTKKMDKDFKPNLTPRQMFKMGSFGGTYWRPIKSKFHNTTLKNKHKKYSFLKDIPDKLMTKPFDEYDKKLNKYKKKVGTTLKFWESKGWMKESHPYGWVQWYCDYYSGKRSADDERQIKRWKQLAGPNGRFRKWLITMIMKKGGKDKWDDHSISPAIRQTLQHWGYKLTKKDFENELKNRKK